jgi:Aspartyl protease
MIMIRGFLLAFILLLSMNIRGAHAADCQLRQYASLDLTVLPNGFLVIPVSIQGTTAGMILNTADPFSTIAEGAARRMGMRLKQLPTTARVLSGADPIKLMATAKDFSVGKIQFKSAELMVVADSIVDPYQGGMPIIGILGMDVLGRFDVDVDIANRKMNLFSQDHCAGQVVYWAKSYDSAPIYFGELGELYFPMELDGKKIETTLATGNQTTSLSTDVTKALYNFDIHTPGIEEEHDSAGKATAYYRAMKLSGEGIQIINAHIMLIDRPVHDSCSLGQRSGAAAYEGCLGAHPLRLGLNVLTKLHFYIAPKEKVLYFTPSEPAK